MEENVNIEYAETKYIPFFSKRFVFQKLEKGWKYVGWYHPNLNKVLEN